MTLVAAFPMRNIPVLIGDFLLTTGEINAKHMFLPTRPDLQRTPSTKERRRIVGMRKKIHKIGERLVVGFTGDLTPGEKLIEAMVKEFGNKSPTKAELEIFLSELAIVGKQKTQLVGWIWENRPLCFEWHGTNPSKVKIVNSSVLGSGAQHFL